MVYDDAPPYTVQHTGCVTADEMQRFTRLARYWDLIANSGRFQKSLRLLIDPADSPFQAFLDFSDWLWGSTHLTSGLTPEALVDLLFDFLTTVRSSSPQLVRETLLADYLQSGAKAKPKVLQALLTRRAMAAGNRRSAVTSSAGGLAQRQARHIALDAA